MKLHRWRAFVILLVLCLSGALGRSMRPTDYLVNHEAKINLEQIFPSTFGDWQIDNNQPASIVSPDVQAQLDELYNQVLTRTYVNKNGDRIMLSVAYGGDQSDATRAHRPDVCYPAQGFEIVSNKDALIPLPIRELPVAHMVARLGPRHEPVTFWFAVGDHTAVSGQEQKLAELRYAFRGLIADGMLVRVSSIDRDTAEAYALQTRFIQQMQAAFDPVWSPRVFGSATASK